MRRKKKGERLERLIAEDNVDELSKILDSNEILQNNFNSFHFTNYRIYSNITTKERN